MSVIVPDEILTVTRMTEAEMGSEIAVMIFSARSRIPVHNGIDDFAQDMQNLGEMGRL